MLGGVFHLHEQEAREVMTPIPAVVTVDASETVEAALRRCITSGHTRLVVIEDDNPDRVKGIVHNNSLARLYMSDGPEATIETVIRDALIVPETRPLDDLLHDLQVQRTSLSVVVDEYGRTVGIVTVEDILEEVVGEIEDETDPRAAALRRLTNGDWFVRGHVSLGDLDRRRDRAAGRHRRLQLGRRLRLRRARPAAQARRLDQRQRLHDPGRGGAREPDRGGPDQRQRQRRGRRFRPFGRLVSPGNPRPWKRWRYRHVGCTPDRQAARGPEGAAALRGASRPGAARARSRPSTWPAGTSCPKPSCPGTRSRSSPAGRGSPKRT